MLIPHLSLVYDEDPAYHMSFTLTGGLEITVMCRDSQPVTRVFDQQTLQLQFTYHSGREIREFLADATDLSNRSLSIVLIQLTFLYQAWFSMQNAESYLYPNTGGIS